MFVLRVGEQRKMEHSAWPPIGEEHGGLLKRNQFEISRDNFDFQRSGIFQKFRIVILRLPVFSRLSFVAARRVRSATQKSFLCAPECTALQTCTSAHIRAFYDQPISR
jgi:hypothetical protein